MREKLLYIFILIITWGCSCKTFGQVNMDSLEKKILNSVQKQLDESGASKYIPDSAKIFSGKHPAELDQLFKEFNKGIEVAKSMGDIKKLTGGYHELSAIDSVRGNYRGAYENYKLYTLYRDSLQKKETEQKELKAQMQYEFDKKQAIAKAEQDKKDADAKRIKNQQYFAIAGLAVLCTGNYFNCVYTIEK